jgi:hypothetical protein
MLLDMFYVYEVIGGERYTTIDAGLGTRVAGDMVMVGC